MTNKKDLKDILIYIKQEIEQMMREPEERLEEEKIIEGFKQLSLLSKENTEEQIAQFEYSDEGKPEVIRMNVEESSQVTEQAETSNQGGNQNRDTEVTKENNPRTNPKLYTEITYEIPPKNRNYCTQNQIPNEFRIRNEVNDYTILNIDRIQGKKRIEAFINWADKLRYTFNTEGEKFDTTEKVDLLIRNRLEGNILIYWKNTRLTGENRPSYYLESVIEYLTKIFTGESSLEDENAKIKRANEAKQNMQRMQIFKLSFLKSFVIEYEKSFYQLITEEDRKMYVDFFISKLDIVMAQKVRERYESRNLDEQQKQSLQVVINIIY